MSECKFAVVCTKYKATVLQEWSIMHHRLGFCRHSMFDTELNFEPCSMAILNGSLESNTTLAGDSLHTHYLLQFCI